MQLNDSQLGEFAELGYLHFPGLLNGDEVAVLQGAMPEILNRQGPELIREKTDRTNARLIFGAHTFSEPFRRLALLPRMLNSVRQLLCDEVYLHQSRLNPKPGYGRGTAWDWHQDFPPWHTIDGMPEPRCVMAAVFIDDCTAVKSPLLVVPGTHRHGLMDAKLHEDADGEGYDLYHIDQATMKRLADENGIEALIGPAGSISFIHCNLLHGSANNVSPWRRAIMYLIYNAVSNACSGSERPWYQNNRDFTPLQPLEDDCLKSLKGV
jgi:ectoine hydroxylase